LTARQVAYLAEIRRRAANGEARAARIAADITLAEIAEVVGVDRSTICRWENGQRVPRGPAALVYGRTLALLERRPRRQA
jgi:transcriptional regulator with XRE-family HTH domain